MTRLGWIGILSCLGILAWASASYAQTAAEGEQPAAAEKPAEEPAAEEKPAEEPAAAEKPAEQPAAEPAAAAAPAADAAPAAEPAAAPAAAAGPAAAEFQAKLAEWRKLLGRLKELQLEYKVAKPDERTKIEEQYNQLLAEGEKMAPEVIKAAEGAYAADPKGDAEVANFLIAVAYNDLRTDKYEEALRLGKLLTETKAPNPQTAQWAGIAAFALNDYDTAEALLKQAKDKKAIDQEGESFLSLIPEYREMWAKEQAAREKEAQTDDLPRVVLKTTKGDITIELFGNEAPNTVANFVALVDKKFYDGLPFHRVLHGFMAQGGDPKGNGSGGPGYTIPCECYSENHRNHFRGTLSMAHAGKDTGGSQFFLTFRPTAHLNGKHTVFGRVIEGFDVITKLKQRDPEQQGVDAVEPDKILEAKVLRKRDHEYKPETKADK